MFFKLLVFVVVLCAAQASHYNRRLVRRSHHEQGIQSADVHHESTHQEPKFDIFALSGDIMGNWSEVTKEIVWNNYLQKDQTGENSAGKCSCVSVEVEIAGNTYKNCMKKGINAINKYKNCATDNKVVAEIQVCLQNVQNYYNQLFGHVKGDKCSDATNVFQTARVEFQRCVSLITTGLDRPTQNGLTAECQPCYEQLRADWEKVRQKYRNGCQ